MTLINVFGDRISFGCWDEEGGWVDRIKQEINKKVLKDPEFPWLAHNLGVDGDTSKGLLKRFEQETKPRIVYGGDTIFVFSIGDNDSLFNNKKKEHWVSPEEYKKNLQELFKLAKNYKAKILFVGSAGFDESKVDPVPWEPECSYKNEYAEQYNEIAKEVCKENQVAFVDIFGLDKKHLVDGLHPNSEGHKKIFEVVKNALEKNNIISF